MFHPEIARRYKRMEDVLKFLSTYEKWPTEIVKDDFAYDRLLDFVHQQAKEGLK